MSEFGLKCILDVESSAETMRVVTLACYAFSSTSCRAACLSEELYIRLLVSLKALYRPLVRKI